MGRNIVPLPPGPSTPSAWQLLRYSRSPLAFLEECARRYRDPFTIRWAGYGTFVMLASPDAVKDVFQGDPHSLHSGEGNEFLDAIVGTNSILVLDDELHARQRRVLFPPLKGERMRSFFDVMQETTLEIVRAWPLGGKLGMLKPMQEITLKVMLKVVLGVTSSAQLSDFTSKVRRVLELGRGRYGLILVKVLPIGLLQRTRWLPIYQRMHELNVALFAFIENCRQKRAAERGENVLADLLEAVHDNGQPLSDQEIRDALVTLIFAGHDTTSVALAWVLEQAVPREDVVQRITDELQQVTGGAPLECQSIKPTCLPRCRNSRGLAGPHDPTVRCSVDQDAVHGRRSRIPSRRRVVPVQPPRPSFGTLVSRTGDVSPRALPGEALCIPRVVPVRWRRPHVPGHGIRSLRDEGRFERGVCHQTIGSSAGSSVRPGSARNRTGTGRWGAHGGRESAGETFEFLNQVQISP